MRDRLPGESGEKPPAPLAEELHEERGRGDQRGRRREHRQREQAGQREPRGRAHHLDLPSGCRITRS